MLVSRTPAGLRRWCARAAAAGALLTALGCGSSKIILDWREPSFAGPPLRKVLVVAVKSDPTRRRIWEDAFVNALTPSGAEATPSYRLFPDALPDTAAVVAAVRQHHFEGVVVTHRVNTATVTRTIPGGRVMEPVGTFHDPFYGSYDTAYREVHAPDLLETDKVVRDRTDVWDSRGRARIVYQGYTESTNPVSATALSKDISRLVVPRLRDRHIF